VERHQAHNPASACSTANTITGAIHLLPACCDMVAICLCKIPCLPDTLICRLILYFYLVDLLLISLLRAGKWGQLGHGDTSKRTVGRAVKQLKQSDVLQVRGWLTC
jgi:hypothetical protein